VQPVQLSLMPEEVPAPPVTLVEQRPEPEVAAALMLLAHLIARVADPTTAADGGEAVGDE
jgi:hypothetical protein